jgi:hypothetical protein
MGKDPLIQYAGHEGRAALDRLKDELPRYIYTLIQQARKVDYEQRHGEKYMRELIRQGIYYHIEQFGKEERESHELLEDARKLLNL